VSKWLKSLVAVLVFGIVFGAAQLAMSIPVNQTLLLIGIATPLFFVISVLFGLYDRSAGLKG